jgi:hypothetical protein
MIEPSKYLFLDPSDERWVAFTASKPQANIFHHPAWTKLLADCYGYRPFVVAVRDSNDNICAGLPMMELGGLLTGRRWISLPFTDHCAPLHHSVGSQSYLLTSLVHLSQDHSTPKIELRCEFPPHPAIRLCSHQVLHTLPLCPDSDSVAARFHSTHRRNIRVAQKRGVRIEWGEQRTHMEAFYRLHLQTRRRQGIPIQPWRFFDILESDLIEKGLGFVLLAHKDDECLAAAVFLHWQHTLTYKYGASAADGLNLRPNNLLFWTAIRWGCEHGYTLFDMGRTDLANTGLRAFKSGWGADEMPLAYSTLSTEPSRPMADKLMPIMHTVIRSSPLWVCRAMGKLLYKHFG